MTWLAILAAFLLGIGAGWSASRYGVSKRQTDLREFRMLVRRPVDLEPSEYTGFWQERA